MSSYSPAFMTNPAYYAPLPQSGGPYVKSGLASMFRPVSSASHGLQPVAKMRPQAAQYAFTHPIPQQQVGLNSLMPMSRQVHETINQLDRRENMEARAATQRQFSHANYY
jgi:hypothetical protein